MGLICSVCEGRGTVEPHSVKLNNRFLPYFSMFFVLLLLVFLAIVIFWGNKEYFQGVLGFVSAMTGSITAYYFGGRANGSTEQKASSGDA
jgi:uncharacterized iron-regulated membrane protein